MSNARYIPAMTHPVILDGTSLTVDQVVAIARQWAPVVTSADASKRAAQSRAVLEQDIARGDVIYGVNTGFGRLANVHIPSDDLLALQRNLIVSHVAGVGDPLPLDVVRAIMLLRANVLLKETSGVRPLLADQLAAMLNAGIHPIVPEQGSVGASGDLAALAHVAYALIGEGEVDVAPPGTEPTDVERVTAAEALRSAGIAPVTLQAKEGLSFINGTQAQCGILALLVHDSLTLWRAAHGAAAMSVEALLGTPVPFDERIQAVRPYRGQQESAALMRELLAESEIRESHRLGDDRVQDAYSLRCIPQILGAVRDAIDYCAGIVAIELNAATDNPLVFGQDVLSGGNFHGQPVAFALDMLAIAITTLAGVAERRVDRMLNPDSSQGLPAFLAKDPGLQSGLMMLQVTAAALVAESRTLCTPASVQSIPTNGNQEDFVPMGMAAAFKCSRIIENALRVVAAELIAASQALEYRKPLRPGRGVGLLVDVVRSSVAALDGDRPIAPDVERIAGVIRDGAFA